MNSAIPTVTDTQVLSYYYSGALPSPEETVRISSVTAAEFLLIQSPEHNKANYYPLLPSRYRHWSRGGDMLSLNRRHVFDSKKHAASGKRRTDQLILNLGPTVPPYIEYGCHAISQLINDQREELYLACVSHLDKDRQRLLRDKFRFLLELRAQSLPAMPIVVDIALNLLAAFQDRYQLKENVRNSVNDMLILATAIHHESMLRTQDNLLRRFAAEMMGVNFTIQQGLMLIDFSIATAKQRRISLESKGYINRGWQVLERRSTR